jgi:hypothetical protein
VLARAADLDELFSHNDRSVQNSAHPANRQANSLRQVQSQLAPLKGFSARRSINRRSRGNETLISELFERIWTNSNQSDLTIRQKIPLPPRVNVHSACGRIHRRIPFCHFENCRAEPAIDAMDPAYPESIRAILRFAESADILLEAYSTSRRKPAGVTRRKASSGLLDTKRNGDR